LRSFLIDGDNCLASKATLASVRRKVAPGTSIGVTWCKMGLEGIVSNRLGSRYRSGRSRDWLKGEAEEDWG
jgi:hypothetical protein